MSHKKAQYLMLYFFTSHPQSRSTFLALNVIILPLWVTQIISLSNSFNSLGSFQCITLVMLSISYKFLRLAYSAMSMPS